METRSSERKWTPGPWTISTENDVCTQIDGEYHAVCTDQFCYAPEVEREANAHLIAAAPDLYEALEQARDTILELINARNSEAEGSDEDWVGGINAALAKARGEK